MKNREGYMDITAQTAIGHVDNEQKRFNKLAREFSTMCIRNGFKPEKITLKANETNRYFSRTFKEGK